MEWTLYPRGAMEWRGVDSKTIVDWMDFFWRRHWLEPDLFHSLIAPSLKSEDPILQPLVPH